MYKVSNSAYLHSYTWGGNFCALKFWSTLRPLISLLLFFTFCLIVILVTGYLAVCLFFSYFSPHFYRCGVLFSFLFQHFCLTISWKGLLKEQNLFNWWLGRSVEKEKKKGHHISLSEKLLQCLLPSMKYLLLICVVVYVKPPDGIITIISGWNYVVLYCNGCIYVTE